MFWSQSKCIKKMNLFASNLINERTVWVWAGKTHQNADIVLPPLWISFAAMLKNSSNWGHRWDMIIYAKEMPFDFSVFKALPSELVNHNFLHHIFLRPECSLPRRQWWARAAPYPPLPASPVWSKLCPGCFLPHIGTVLHLPSAHYGSLNSQIQGLQFWNFPAKDRDMSLKTALDKDTLALFH